MYYVLISENLSLTLGSIRQILQGVLSMLKHLVVQKLWYMSTQWTGAFFFSPLLFFRLFLSFRLKNNYLFLFFISSRKTGPLITVIPTGIPYGQCLGTVEPLVRPTLLPRFMFSETSPCNHRRAPDQGPSLFELLPYVTLKLSRSTS